MFTKVNFCAGRNFKIGSFLNFKIFRKNYKNNFKYFCFFFSYGPPIYDSVEIHWWESQNEKQNKLYEIYSVYAKTREREKKEILQNTPVFKKQKTKFILRSTKQLGMRMVNKWRKVSTALKGIVGRQVKRKRGRKYKRLCATDKHEKIIGKAEWLFGCRKCIAHWGI